MLERNEILPRGAHPPVEAVPEARGSGAWEVVDCQHLFSWITMPLEDVVRGPEGAISGLGRGRHASDAATNRGWTADMVSLGKDLP